MTHLRTRAVHAGQHPDPASGAIAMPITQSTAFAYGSLERGAAIFAASPATREAVLGKEIISQTGVDNSAILAADLDNFDFEIKINDVAEDENNYYVDYSFRTLEIQDNIRQAAQRRSSMTIDKLSLAGKDLGLYVQEQLVQIAQNEQNYLKQVQAAETKKGPTQIARAAEYTGLIGLVLDAKNAILPGYDPVVKPAPAELTVASPDAPEEIGGELHGGNGVTALAHETLGGDGDAHQRHATTRADRQPGSRPPAPVMERALVGVIPGTTILIALLCLPGRQDDVHHLVHVVAQPAGRDADYLFPLGQHVHEEPS